MVYEDVILSVRADDTEANKNSSETIHVINECVINGNDYQEECNHANCSQKGAFNRVRADARTELLSDKLKQWCIKRK